MHDGVDTAHSLQRELTYLLTCGRHNLVSGTQNDIVVSWIALWGMIKVYWLDFSLRFGSGCLLHVCRKFGPKLTSHEPVRKWNIVCQTVWTRFSEPKLSSSSIKKWSIVCQTVWTRFSEPKLSSSSIKKRSIVRQTVQSMFGELTVWPFKNRLNIQIIII